MNDSLNAFKKTKGKKTQIDLSIRKDGLHLGTAWLVPHTSVVGKKIEPFLLFFVPVSNQHEVNHKLKWNEAL